MKSNLTVNNKEIHISIRSKLLIYFNYLILRFILFHIQYTSVSFCYCIMWNLGYELIPTSGRNYYGMFHTFVDCFVWQRKLFLMPYQCLYSKTLCHILCRNKRYINFCSNIDYLLLLFFCVFSGNFQFGCKVIFCFITLLMVTAFIFCYRIHYKTIFLCLLLV